MTTADELIKRMDKDYGIGIASRGAEPRKDERIGTGIFPFDLATGGGFPLGRISIVWGQESSMKTTLCLLAIAQHQRQHPDLSCVFVDVEARYEPAWGAILGVDNDRLIYVVPDYAEQVVDIVEALLAAEDVGLIVLDSLAALIGFNEAGNSADRVNVGGAALVAGKLYRKATLAMSRAMRDERYPALIAINQVRYKIGVMRGNPETMPGGQPFKFGSSLTVRVYGKDIMENKIHTGRPSYKNVSGVIQKYSVPIVSRAFEFKMGVINSPSHGVELGKVDAWNTILAYAKDAGLVGKVDGGGWHLYGEPYKTLKAIRADVYASEGELEKLQTLVVQHAIEAEGVEVESDDEA